LETISTSSRSSFKTPISTGNPAREVNEATYHMSKVIQKKKKKPKWERSTHPLLQKLAAHPDFQQQQTEAQP
jgi:hypothetical protein